MGLRAGIARCVLLLAFTLPLLNVTPAQAQASSTVPYIYYYSDRIGAFVVERADGTDTHTFGTGLSKLHDPNLAITVGGPGWSPSGDWFAWTVSPISPFGESADERRFGAAKVISADGSKQITTFDHLQFAHWKLLWSPGQDVILATAEDENFKTNDVTSFFALVAPATNRVVYTETEVSNQPYVPRFHLSALWTLDGHAIIERGAAVGYKFYIVDTSGNETELTISNPISNISSSGSSVSVNGDVLYRTSSGLASVNLISGKRHYFNLAIKGILNIEWSPYGQYGLVLDDTGSISLLNFEESTLHPLQSLSITSNDLDLLSEFNQSLWSPDGRFALVPTVTNVFEIDLKTASVFPVPISTNPTLSEIGWYWLDNHRVVIGGVDNSKQVSSPNVYIYDLDLRTSTKTFVKIGSYAYSRVQLSPDQQKLAFMADGPVIYDISSSQYHYLRPAAGSFNSARGGAVEWDQGGDWLLSYDEGLVASGGLCCRYLGIVNATNYTTRELSFLWWPVTAAGAGWLPPNVKTERLPPPLKYPLVPSPAATLQGIDWLSDLEWSPDSKQLAGSVGLESNDRSVSVWNVGTGKRFVAFEHASSGQLVGWQQDSQGNYQPYLLSPSKRDFLAASPNGQLQFVYSGADLGYRIIEVDSGKVIAQLKYGPGVYFSTASFSPDGKLLAMAGPNERATIIETRTWKSIVTLPEPAVGLAFSPDGKLLAATRSWDVDLWNVSALLAH